MNIKKFSSGQVILMTEGTYGAERVVGYLVSLCELDVKGEVEAFKEKYKPRNEWDRPGPDEFVEWLCSNQKCTQLNYQAIHLGSDGELEVK